LARVYKKPHTIGYLHYKSNHSTRVKKGVVKCLYDRAERVINMKDNLAKKELYLHQVFTTNEYSDGIKKAGSKESP